MDGSRNSCPPIAFISSRMTAMTLARTRMAERQQRVVTCHQLADEPGPQQQPVAGRVGVRRVLSQGRDVQL